MLKNVVSASSDQQSAKIKKVKAEKDKLMNVPLKQNRGNEPGKKLIEEADIHPDLDLR